MDYLHIIVPSVIILSALVTIIILHFKKKAVIKKVIALSSAEKQKMLDILAEPLGYCYNPNQDIFTSTLDAPQKIFGYTTLFDLYAPYFNMIFDYETIYFNYNSRTWLLEIWKGQYGINSGCEIGLYYADSVIPPGDYSSTHFKSVEDKDMLELSFEVNRNDRKKGMRPVTLGKLSRKHWWLTLFKMGIFTKPRNLSVDASLRFKDYPMMYSFLHSFEKTLPDIPFYVDGLNVSFTFHHSNRSYSFFKRTVRHIALTACKVYCKLFLFITRPFSNSGDKLLYLYYYLPFVVRMIFKQKSKK